MSQPDLSKSEQPYDLSKLNALGYNFTQEDARRVARGRARRLEAWRKETAADAAAAAEKASSKAPVGDSSNALPAGSSLESKSSNVAINLPVQALKIPQAGTTVERGNPMPAPAQTTVPLVGRPAPSIDELAKAVFWVWIEVILQFLVDFLKGI